MAAQELEQDRQAATDASARAQPRDVAAERDERGAAATEAYARDHEGLRAEHEVDALAYLLGGGQPGVWTVPVTILTPAGEARMEWDVRPQDARVMDRIERDSVSASGQIDTITADAELLARATVCLRSPMTGRETRLDSVEFLTVPNERGEPAPLASAADALEARFRKQWGVCANVAAEVRRVSGYDRTNVGRAHRRLTDAAGNS